MDDVAPPAHTTEALLRLHRDREWFAILGLPEPSADELGRPVWPCSDRCVQERRV